MPITVRCPNPACAADTAVPDEAVGRKVRCPGCRTVFEARPAVAGDTATPHGTGRTAVAPAPVVGRFEVRGRLGAGAFGTVYRAYDPRLDREVALKVPNPGVLSDAKRVERFLREAKAAANLRHPNIVPVFDAGTDGGRHFIASAFIEGQPVADAVGEAGLELRRAARLTRELAEALAYAHEQGVVHRDVKPHNCMLDRADHLLLMDFGLAARTTDTGEAKLTNDGAVMGTPAYMAPEQAEGRTGEAGPPADQYACGVVLYELLTGRTPFEGPPAIVIFNVLNTTPEPPRTHRPDVPRDLETVCLKAMAKRPADRYPDCRALADDLRRWLDGEPVTARRLGPAERFARWGRKNPALAAAAAAVGLALAATAGLAVTVAVRETAHAGALEREGDATREALDRAEKQEAEAKTQARAARRSAGRLALDRGLGLCEAGDAAGLLWLARGLEHADAAGDPDLDAAIRANLADWSAAAHPLRAVLSHPRPVRSVAYTPDGRTVVTASETAVRFWDVETGRESGPPIATPYDAKVVAVSPDGTRLAVGGEVERAGRVQLFELPARRPLADAQPTGGRVTRVTFSPDGKTVLAADRGNAVSAWDAAGGRLGWGIDHPAVAADVAFSPDGKTVAAARPGVARGAGGAAGVWEAGTGRAVGGPMQHDRDVGAVAFSRDGKTLATGAADGRVRFWQDGAESGGPPAPDHKAPVYCLAYSPDGRWLASGGADHTVRLREAATGRPVGPPLHHPGEVWSVAFSPDSRSVAAASRGGEARVWAVAAPSDGGKPFGPTAGATRLAVSPDGSRVLADAPDGRVLVLDPDGQELDAGMRHGYRAVGLAFTRDGRWVATGSADQTARVWEFPSGRPAAGPFRLDTDHPANGPIEAVAFSPDGRTVAAGGLFALGCVRLWDRESGKPLKTLDAPSTYSLAFSPDGRTLAVGYLDGSAALWNPATGKPVGPPLSHFGSVYRVAFSPDGRTVLTASADRTARLWDSATGQPAAPPLVGHEARVRAAAFGPDGRLVATAGDDRTVRFWSAAVGVPLGRPRRQTGVVTDVAFLPGRGVLLSAGRDDPIRAWPLPAGMPGAPGQVSARIRAATGLELAGEGVVRALAAAEWAAARAEAGGG